jgi:hypothetical protein
MLARVATSHRLARLGLGAAALALALAACNETSKPVGALETCPSCPHGQSLSCPLGQSVCDGSDGEPTCVDLQSDAANCGLCGRQCGAGEQCVARTCQAPAATGCPVPCGDGATCINGTCQPNGCPPPLAVCNRGAALACVDLARDPLNCGTCGLHCQLGESCVDTVCQQPVDCTAAGFHQCPAGCVDLASDPQNCGACGVACPTGCANGVCF